MEFVSDFFARKFGVGSGAAQTPEWSGIRLRLAAAHSARRELLTAELGAEPNRGSFADGAAIALAELHQCKLLVNPIGLEGGKSDDTRDGPSHGDDPKVAG